jgi:hypothetical protein
VEAAVAMLTALALLVVNGLVSRSQGWRLPGTPWWTWVVRPPRLSVRRAGEFGHAHAPAAQAQAHLHRHVELGERDTARGLGAASR